MIDYKRFSVVEVGDYVYIFGLQDMADAFATCLDGCSIGHCETIHKEFFKKVHVTEFHKMLEKTVEPISDEGHGNDYTHDSDGPT